MSSLRAVVQSMRSFLQTSSTSVRARQFSGTQILRISGYSLIDRKCPPGLSINSAEFPVGNNDWMFDVWFNDKGVTAKSGNSLSASIWHTGSSKLVTEYTVSILDRDKEPAFSRSMGPYISGRDNVSCDNIVTVEELRRSKQRLVGDDDCLNVRCDITVIECEEEGHLRRWLRNLFRI